MATICCSRPTWLRTTETPSFDQLGKQRMERRQIVALIRHGAGGIGAPASKVFAHCQINRTAAALQATKASARDQETVGGMPVGLILQQTEPLTLPFHKCADRFEQGRFSPHQFAPKDTTSPPGGRDRHILQRAVLAIS